MSAEDTTLVQRCLQGECEAQRALVQRYQLAVYGFCVRMVGDRHEAEDIAQEVFYRIFRSLKRWDSTRPLKPWIMGITVNRCRSHLSQRAKRPELASYLQETTADQPNDDYQELLQEIHLALKQIREDYRVVFILFHEQGMPYEAIAETMERPVGTIKTWLHRARIQVLDQLRQRGMVSEVSYELPGN